MAIKWIDNEKEKMEKELMKLRIENDVKSSMFADVIDQVKGTMEQQNAIIRSLATDIARINDLDKEPEESPMGATATVQDAAPTEFPTVEPIALRGFHDALYHDGKGVAEILESNVGDSRRAFVDVVRLLKSIDSKLDTLIAKMPAQYPSVQPPEVWKTHTTCKGTDPYSYSPPNTSTGNPYIPGMQSTDADAGQSTNDFNSPPSADTYKEE